MTELSPLRPDVERELLDHSDGFKTIIIRQQFQASPSAIWDALTLPDEVSRWYLPVSGELREGGFYALEGSAVGQIHRCEKPRSLQLTWVYDEYHTELWLRLWVDGAMTTLELEQSPVPENMVANPTPELWGLATAWEMCFRDLQAYLEGRLPDGRAVDRMSLLTAEERGAALLQGWEISDAWERLLVAEGRSDTFLH